MRIRTMNGWMCESGRVAFEASTCADDAVGGAHRMDSEGFEESVGGSRRDLHGAEEYRQVARDGAGVGKDKDVYIAGQVSRGGIIGNG